MHRVDSFKISQRPYAVDLSSLRVNTSEPNPQQGRYHRIHHIGVDAVWFRRRRGVTVACVGSLWYLDRDPAPADAPEALARHTDGRYGGDCQGRWDGVGYWGAQPPELAAEHMQLLRPMLENYPAVPPGYDGWWSFVG